MRRRVAALVTAVVSALLLVLTPTAALAHGDVVLADEAVELAPGATASFAGALHYHRLAARITADGPVIVEVVRAGTGEVVARGGPSAVVALDDLIACCDDATWTTHRLVVTNVGDAEVRAEVDARLLHDDLAVTVFGAEPGARASVLLLGVALAAVLLRTWRRRRATSDLTSSARLLVGLVLAATALALLGAARFGAAWAAAAVTGLAVVPVLPTNPVVSRMAVAVLVGMVLWAVAAVRWVRAHGRAETRAWVGLGSALVATSLVTAAALVATYGTWPVPVAMAVLAATPLLATLTAGIRHADGSAGDPSA